MLLFAPQLRAGHVKWPAFVVSVFTRSPARTFPHVFDIYLRYR